MSKSKGNYKPDIVYIGTEIISKNDKGHIDRIYYIVRCNFCGKEVKKHRSHTLFCGNTCRKRAQLSREMNNKA